MHEILTYLKDAFYILYVLAILTAVIALVLENRNPLKTIAWILVMTCLPIVGFIAYLLFGQKWYKRHIIGKRTLKKFAQSPAMRRLEKSLSTFPQSQWKLASFFIKTESSFPFPANAVTPYFDGADFIISLLREISHAKQHIHLEYYIFMDDATGHIIADALIEKAAQGVKIRVIVDDLGCWKTHKHFFDRLEKHNIEVVKFLPVKTLPIQSRINYRNHRKLTIIDGKTGFIGGMNIADRYIKGVKWGVWRDTQIMIRGYAVHQMQLTFIRDWYFATKQSLLDKQYFPMLENCGTAIVQIATSAPFDKWQRIMQGLVLAISRAKDYFFIETPYFMPTEQVLMALQTAALSGIDVRLIVPQHSDSMMTQLATRSYLKDLLKSGVKVYMYKAGFIHSKMIVSDDLLTVIGSCNMDFRSFLQNFEANAFIYDKDFAAIAKRQFQADQAQSVRVTHQVWKHRKWHIKVKESIVRIFSPLL